jgi:hypothetical protein
MTPIQPGELVLVDSFTLLVARGALTKRGRCLEVVVGRSTGFAKGFVVLTRSMIAGPKAVPADVSNSGRRQRLCSSSTRVLSPKGVDVTRATQVLQLR